MTPLSRTLAVLLLVPAGGASQPVVDGTPRGADPLPPRADSAREEVRAGRFLHAERHLERLEGDAADTVRAVRRLRAAVAARSGRWEEVRRALERVVVSAGAGSGDLLLFGRAALALDDHREAVDAFGRVLEAPPTARDEVAARIGRIRARFASGDPAGAVADVREAAGRYPGLGDWLWLEAARRAAGAGEAEVAAASARRIRRRDVADRARLPVVEAYLASGRPEEALRLAAEGARAARDRRIRGRLWTQVGDLHWTGGREEAARTAYRRALETRAPGEGGTRAARRLAVGADDPESLELAASTLAAAGETGEALDLVDEIVGGPGGPVAGTALVERVRLRRGRLLYRAGRWRSAEEAMVEAAAGASGADAAEALLIAGRAAYRDGRSARGRELLLRLADAHPGTSEAALGVFLLADMAHDRGDVGEAAELYRKTRETSPGDDRAGLARMRLAQLAVGRGDTAAAVEEYEAYVEAYPRGRRWEEARYWAGVLRLELDADDARGPGHLREIRTRNPLSYYAFLAAEALGVAPGLPSGDFRPSPRVVEDVARELEVVELLEAADLDGPARAEVARAVAREGRGDGETLALAEALVERGYVPEGVRVGYRLLARGRGWSDRLLRVVYPLPHRTLIRREAEEWGLDPHLVAGIVRRESVFDPRAVSGAGAVGMMQVLPSTGRALARREGIEGFRRELLTRPDISVHLGAAHLADFRSRWGKRLPVLLAAYNAGPGAARRWLELPEASDRRRFVERIPYRETRRYVKAVTANRRIYALLYGDGDGAADAPD